MHQDVEHEKRLAAFWRAPKDAKADARDQSFDEIGRRCVERDFVERDKLEACLLRPFMAPPLRSRRVPRRAELPVRRYDLW